MPVRLEDAEEYELPDRHDDLGAGVSSGTEPAGEHDSEHARLLEREGKPSGDFDDEDDIALRRQSIEDEAEIVGKGDKIHTLIARVSGSGLWRSCDD